MTELFCSVCQAPLGDKPRIAIDIAIWPGEKANVWLEVHHKRPVSRGGGYGPGNLISLCKTCHEKVHTR